MLTAYLVDSLADVVADDGLVTLREAIEAANANGAVFDAPAGSEGEVDTIGFAPELFLDGEDPAPGVITLGGSRLVVSDDLKISGPGAELLAIDANGSSQVLEVEAEANLALSGLTVSGGYAASGAGIYNRGNLAASRVTIADNRASYYGGGLYNAGTATFVASTFATNDAVYYGGGGIYNNDGSVALVNCVLVGNEAGYGGGMAGVNCDAVITNSTITGNVGEYEGGGLATHDANFLLVNSVVALNVAPVLAQISGGLTAGSEANLIGGDPRFAANPVDGGDGWGDNPATHDTDEAANDDLGDLSLSKDSPAINVGANDGAAGVDGLPLTTDMVGGPRVIYDVVDIGAFEYRLPGDANGDMKVNAIDAAILAANFGSTDAFWERGDFTADGFVDERDAAVMASHWGNTLVLPVVENSTPQQSSNSEGFIGPLPAGASGSRVLLAPDSRRLRVASSEEAQAACCDAALAEMPDRGPGQGAAQRRPVAWSWVLARRESRQEYCPY